MPPRLHPVEAMCVALSSLSVRPRRSVHLAGDVALPRCSRRRGGSGNEGEVVDDGGQEGKRLFVYDVYVTFRQTPLTRLSIKRGWSLSHNITNLSHHAPFIY